MCWDEFGAILTANLQTSNKKNWSQAIFQLLQLLQYFRDSERSASFSPSSCKNAETSLWSNTPSTVLNEFIVGFFHNINGIGTRAKHCVAHVTVQYIDRYFTKSSSRLLNSPSCPPLLQCHPSTSAYNRAPSYTGSQPCTGWTGWGRAQPPAVLQCFWSQCQMCIPFLPVKSVIHLARCGSTLSLSLRRRGWMMLKALKMRLGHVQHPDDGDLHAQIRLVCELQWINVHDRCGVWGHRKRSSEVFTKPLRNRDCTWCLPAFRNLSWRSGILTYSNFLHCFQHLTASKCPLVQTPSYPEWKGTADHIYLFIFEVWSR